MPEEEQRRSGRIRNLPAPIYTTFERDEDLGDRVARRRGDATTTPRSKPTAKKPSKPAAPPAVGSIKTLDARITRCAAEYLGAKIAPPPGSGALKEAVIRELAPVANPRFSKYSGIQEWRNCVCLFVNVGDKHGNSYDNVFTHAGGRIAWFAQPTQDEETPVVARIPATADARFDAVQDATAPEGMRWRPEEEPTRRPDDDAKKAKKKDAKEEGVEEERASPRAAGSRKRRRAPRTTRGGVGPCTSSAGWKGASTCTAAGCGCTRRTRGSGRCGSSSGLRTRPS